MENNFVLKKAIKIERDVQPPILHGNVTEIENNKTRHKQAFFYLYDKGINDGHFRLFIFRLISG